MTYCVGLKLDKGLVFMADTRTNAGIDDISIVRKIHSWEEPGDRVLTLLSAGNLATTQSVVSVLDEHMKKPEDRDPSLMQVPTMFQAAQLVGRTLKQVIQDNEPSGPEAEATFSATLILGGQIKGMPPRLFMIYPEGNFIEAGEDTPFFQIGETKYGKPILLRGFSSAMSFEEAVKLLLVSFDSTIKANLSVGPPIDLLTHEIDALALGHQERIMADDAYFRHIRTGWGDALQKALQALPDFNFKD